MKKIKIVTYCTWTSIGSVLQSLGLKKALEGLDFKSEIWLNSKNNNYEKIKVHSVKSFIKRCYEIIIYGKRKKAHQNRIRFINENIDIEYYNDYKDLEIMAQNDDFDIVLAGSDQIWSPLKDDPIFFLEFVKGKRKVSYAASMGVTKIAPDKVEKFKERINSFEYISVREEECVEAIKPLTSRDVYLHIDPTFLVSADEWRKYSAKYNVKGPYILLYMLFWDESCTKKIKKLKKETGLPVYAITNTLSGVWADKCLYDVDISEFLWLIDNAKYVITSSFHGAAFSLIFNKKFASVINPKSPSRLKNLHRVFSIPEIDIEDLNKTENYDYEQINEIISFEKEKSVRYLRRILS